MKVRVFALLAGLAGCADAVDPVSTVPRVSTPIATLSASGAVGQANGIVTFTARLSAAAIAQRAGAYTARVEFDSSVVKYVGEGAATSGLVAFNATSGVLKVAGASLDGYTGGVLFNARFRVAKPKANAEVRLVIDELRDVNASDRLPAQVMSRTALLRPWK